MIGKHNRHSTEKEPVFEESTIPRKKQKNLFFPFSLEYFLPEEEPKEEPLFLFRLILYILNMDKRGQTGSPAVKVTDMDIYFGTLCLFPSLGSSFLSPLALTSRGTIFTGKSCEVRGEFATK